MYNAALVVVVDVVSDAGGRATSFPGSLIFPAPWSQGGRGGKMRDPRNEVDGHTVIAVVVVVVVVVVVCVCCCC